MAIPDELLESFLHNGTLARVELRHLHRVDLNERDIMTGSCETGAGDRTHIAESDNRYIHVTSLCNRGKRDFREADWILFWDSVPIRFEAGRSCE